MRNIWQRIDTTKLKIRSQTQMHHSTKAHILLVLVIVFWFHFTVVQKCFQEHSFKFSELFNLISLIFVLNHWFMTFVYDLVFIDFCFPCISTLFCLILSSTQCSTLHSTLVVFRIDMQFTGPFFNASCHNILSLKSADVIYFSATEFYLLREMC